MSTECPVADAVASSTASGTNAAGQKVLNVVAGTNFATGQSIVIGLGTAKEQVYTIASVSTNAITLVENLIYAVSSSETVKTCTLD